MTSNTKIIWIVGMGRSGSMWTYNVTREMIRAAGFLSMPERVPHTSKLTLVEANAARMNSNPKARWVLKTHQKVDAAFPRSRFIATRRDPRDVLISQMRFTEIDFGAALKAAMHYTHIADYYARFPTAIRLDLTYTDIVARPADTGGRIGNFLELELNEDARSSIVAQFSKERVSNLIGNMDVIDERKGDDAGSGGEVIRVDENARLFDVGTGFQSGHVSDYRDGDWRTILSAAERAEMLQKLGPWLARNGFD